MSITGGAERVQVLYESVSKFFLLQLSAGMSRLLLSHIYARLLGVSAASEGNESNLLRLRW